MKKLIVLLLTLALLACVPGATAETKEVNALLTDGSFVVQIPVVDGDLSWIADNTAQDDSVVKLYDADVIEDTFVARYDPTGDGDMSVSVRHYIGIACDELFVWDLHVADGAVQEIIGGRHVVSPDEAEQDPFLSGEWQEADTQFARLTIEKNVERGWNVEVVSPVSHGAYIFKTTIYYDCDLDSFVYDKGKFWDAPLDGSTANLGNAAVAGTCGSFALVGDEQGLRLTWYDDQYPERTIAFEPAEAPAPEIVTDVTDFQKYGNLVLGITATDLLAQGYAYGDVIRATVNGQTLELPLCSSYSDVEIGDMLCCAFCDETQDTVLLAINMGDLATTLGIAEKTAIDETPGYRWDYLVDQPVSVSIAMAKKGGYAEEYMLHQLVRSNERADYPDLTDEQYANFRNVATTGMGAGTLYRSSSPVNPQLNRSREADEALNNAGIQTVLNLADDEQTMKSYEGFADSYYSQRNVIPLNMGLDFSSAEFKEQLAKGMELIAANEGPYLVHCTEGKDRAGFVSALLECLMGATVDEVIEDYMVTYFNYYGVQPGAKTYDAIASGNISKILAAAFGVEDIHEADLSACAEEYLRSAGLSDGTIAAIRENLGKSCLE